MRTSLARRRSRAKLVRRLRPWGSWLLGILAALTLFVGMPLLVWRGPWWLDGDYITPALVAIPCGVHLLVTACGRSGPPHGSTSADSAARRP